MLSRRALLFPRSRLSSANNTIPSQYYDAVGPMPPRLQAPLWTSPRRDVAQSTPINARVGPSTSSSEKHTRQHMQDISRHRQQWERAATPPDFWSVAFCCLRVNMSNKGTGRSGSLTLSRLRISTSGLKICIGKNGSESKKKPGKYRNSLSTPQT